MISGSVGKIETLGLLDGPGVRVVVFLNECHLRCKYCHNPEMQTKGLKNYTPKKLVNEILKYKEYIDGVTFSGGEPLLQKDFLIKTCKLLKKYNIHIALDTAGVGIGDYKKILKYVDLILLDIKAVNEKDFTYITGSNTKEHLIFLQTAQKLNKPIWIRQVIVPGFNDNEKYLNELSNYLKTIKNIEKIDFLPYHKLGDEKYKKLNIVNPFKNKKSMDKLECDKLYQKFKTIYQNK